MEVKLIIFVYISGKIYLVLSTQKISKSRVNKFVYLKKWKKKKNKLSYVTTITKIQMVQLYNTAYDLMLTFGTGNHQFRPKESGICCLAYKNNSLSSLEELVWW